MRRSWVLSATACALAAVIAGTAAAQVKKAPPKAPAKKPTAAEQKAQEQYTTVCQPCHGPEGKSPLPMMSLADGEWKHGSSTKEIAKVITEGVPGSAMLPNRDKFTKQEILALAQLVRSFDPKLKPEKK